MKTAVASKTMNMTTDVSQFQVLVDKYQLLIQQFQNNPLFQIFKGQLSIFEKAYLDAYVAGNLDTDACQCLDLFTMPTGYKDDGPVGGKYSDLQNTRMATLKGWCGNTANCPTIAIPKVVQPDVVASGSASAVVAPINSGSAASGSVVAPTTNSGSAVNVPAASGSVVAPTTNSGSASTVAPTTNSGSASTVVAPTTNSGSASTVAPTNSGTTNSGSASTVSPTTNSGSSSTTIITKPTVIIPPSLGSKSKPVSHDQYLLKKHRKLSRKWHLNPYKYERSYGIKRKNYKKHHYGHYYDYVDKSFYGHRVRRGNKRGGRRHRNRHNNKRGHKSLDFDVLDEENLGADGEIY